MNLIDFEKITRSDDHSMLALHSHEHYELYFLLEGERNFFVKNKLFSIKRNTLVVVPPYCLHKTEGGPYKRININISPDLLTPLQLEVLNKYSKITAINIKNDSLKLIISLLEAGEAFPLSAKLRSETLLSITQTLIGLLSLENPTSDSITATIGPNDISPEILKIVHYINKNFSHELTLKELCDKFYICKVALCKKFKEAMNCSIMQYVTQLRINKAKNLLQSSNESIEDIATLCGFSSGNYFGLIFKKAIGVSPLNYRKTR